MRFLSATTSGRSARRSSLAAAAPAFGTTAAEKALAQTEGQARRSFAQPFADADQIRADRSDRRQPRRIPRLAAARRHGQRQDRVYLHLIARVLESVASAGAGARVSLTPQLEARFREAFREARIASCTARWRNVARNLGMARGGSCDAGTFSARAARARAAAQAGADRRRRRSTTAPSSSRKACAIRPATWPSTGQRRAAARHPRTATPSLETWHNWRQKRYSGSSSRSAPRRERSCPRCGPWTCAPTAEDGFSKATLTAIGERLARGEQSLVFINRRGYAPVLFLRGLWLGSELRPVHRAPRAACQGPASGWPSLRRPEAVPRACPTCGNVDLKPMGAARSGWRIARTALPGRPHRAHRSRQRAAARRPVAPLEAIRRGEATSWSVPQLLAKGHDFSGPDAGRGADARHGAPLDRLSRPRAAVRRAGAGGGPRRPPRDAGRGAGADPLSRTSPVRRAWRATTSRLCRLAARGAARAGFPPFVFEASLRAEAKNSEQAVAFLRQAAASVPAPDEGASTIRAAHHHPAAGTSGAAGDAVRSRPALQDYLAD